MKEFVETKSSQVSPIGPQGIRRKSRRKFLKTSAVALGSVSELSMLGRKNSYASAVGSKAQLEQSPDRMAAGNHLERMRTELLKALQKPVKLRKWVMVIDQQKCIGCKA